VSDRERDEQLLQYIAESIALIARYTADGEDAFFREPMIRDAVLRRLETLADATGHLSAELTSRHPDIPWRAIYGFRNVAAHGYLGLDMARVWSTLQAQLPALHAVVNQELKLA